MGQLNMVYYCLFIHTRSLIQGAMTFNPLKEEYEKNIRGAPDLAL